MNNIAYLHVEPEISPQLKGPLTYQQAMRELECSRTSLYRMIAAGTVIREYLVPPTGMPRVYIPTDPIYIQTRTARGSEEKSWQNSTADKARRAGGHRSRTRGAAKQLDDLLASPPNRG